MPKDLIHFKTAKLAAEKLAGTRFAPALAAHHDELLLSSVFHDALFYGVTPSARPLEKVSHALHGADGQDTFTILRLQARHAAAVPDGPAPTVFVGLASHIFADVLMHPMVWHFSGDYYATDPDGKSRARQRHRALESLMDMVACPEMVGRPEYSLRRMLSESTTDFCDSIALAPLAELAGISRARARTGMMSAWAVFAGLQWLFPKRPLARALYSLFPRLPKPVAEVAALFYAPQLLKQGDMLRGDIAFKHPATGESLTASLDNLILEAAAKTADLCRSMEAGIFDNMPIDLPGSGPSMDSGLDEVSTADMRHYAHPPFPVLP